MTSEDAAWVRGFCMALANMHRCLAQGFGSKEIVEVCRAASITLAEAQASGVSHYDLGELQRAGVE